MQRARSIGALTLGDTIAVGRGCRARLREVLELADRIRLQSRGALGPVCRADFTVLILGRWLGDE